MKFSIMDVTGHSEEQYSAAERAAAGVKFTELLRSGHTAAVRAPGEREYALTRELPEGEDAEVLFIPQLKGG